MKEVFISYASEDRAIAQHVAQGLEAAGVSVWWDRHIQVGSEWDKTIEDALAAATCVVVLWTGPAKASRWVRAEARAALQHGQIVPVMLEADAIPLAFTGIQSLRFLGWDGAAESKAFNILLGVIKAKLEGKPVSFPVEAATKASWVGKIAAVVGLKMLVSVTVAVLLMASSLWRLDADVTIQVQTGRLEFLVNPGNEQKSLTDLLSFTKLSLQHVGQMSLSPDQLLVANPDQLDWDTDTYPPEAWVALPSHGRVQQFHAVQSGVSPMVTLESPERKESVVGKLDAIVLSQPATITLEMTNARTISLAIRSKASPQRVVLSGLKRVDVVAEGLTFKEAGILPFSQDQELTYQALFDHATGTITVNGMDSTFIAVINPEASPETLLFSSTELPVESVDVSWQDPKTGERRSHPQFQGTVRYRALPDLPEVNFQAPLFLTVEKLERFEILSIRLDSITETFAIEMQGTAGYLKIGTRDNPQDLRPTVFDVIGYHPILAPVRHLIGL